MLPIYTDDKLKEIERNILSGMDKQEREEEEIIEKANIIANKLLKVGSCKDNFRDIEYSFKLAVTQNYITIVCANINRFKICGNSYRPWIAKVEIDKRITMHENVAVAIRGLFGHMTGNPLIVEEA